MAYAVRKDPYCAVTRGLYLPEVCVGGDEAMNYFVIECRTIEPDWS